MVKYQNVVEGDYKVSVKEVDDPVYTEHGTFTVTSDDMIRIALTAIGTTDINPIVNI